MSATATATYRVNDLVTCTDSKFTGIVWKVRSVPQGARGVNYVMDRVSPGGTRGLRAPATILEPYSGTEEEARAGRAEVISIPLPPLAPSVGAVVLVKGSRKIDPAVLHVVTGDRGTGKVSMARLGGDGGEWRGVAVQLLTEVPVTEVAAHLPAHLAAVGKA